MCLSEELSSSFIECQKCQGGIVVKSFIEHILHKNHAGFFGHVFFSVTETDEMVKIYKKNSKMD